MNKDDNSKNGEDRVVDIIEIKTKYYKTGEKCISECFKNKKFRYYNSDKKLMQIEVPLDKYEDAIKAMEERIKKGEVVGVTDYNEAQNIIRKGNFTYEQAKNIAKARNIDSIKYDALNGSITTTTAFGLSACISFAISIWNGNDNETSLKQATYSGLKVGGVAFATAVISSQLSKVGMNNISTGSTDKIIKLIVSKASSILVNSLKSGKNIYGALAVKSATKLLRGNLITAALSVVVLSLVDIVNIFRGRISGAQLFKNLANTTSSVTGGTLGWMGGATVGADVGSTVPIIGTAIGGIVGGVIGSLGGGMVANKASKKVLDVIIEDDANEMSDIIEKRLYKLVEDYLLNEKEIKNIIENLKRKLENNSGLLKDMYASSNRERFVDELVVAQFKETIKRRKYIVVPSGDKFIVELKNILENISDEEMGNMSINTSSSLCNLS